MSGRTGKRGVLVRVRVVLEGNEIEGALVRTRSLNMEDEPVPDSMSIVAIAIAKVVPVSTHKCLALCSRENLIGVVSIVNGGWTAWSTWQLCSHSCGGGQTLRVRSCTNPRPDFGGQRCSGENSQYTTCNKFPCPGIQHHNSDVRASVL